MISWVKGSRFKVSAEVAKGVMDKLASEERLSATELVKVSMPEDAPLHGEFEWDDEIAGQKWRESQASCMIRSIVVTVEDAPQVENIRAYFNLEQGMREYIPVHVIMSDDAKRERLLDLAIRELASFRKKYEQLTELAGVFAEIDKIAGDDVR